MSTLSRDQTPVTHTAELKVCPVRIEALAESEVAG